MANVGLWHPDMELGMDRCLRRAFPMSGCWVAGLPWETDRREARLRQRHRGGTAPGRRLEERQKRGGEGGLRRGDNADATADSDADSDTDTDTDTKRNLLLWDDPVHGAAPYS